MARLRTRKGLVMTYNEDPLLLDKFNVWAWSVACAAVFIALAVFWMMGG